jgi:glyoxylase-like metal-dependent hydrolase (beta-lactamase superfamily II)
VQIVPGIHQIQVPIPDNPLGHLNSYLLEGKHGWTMIDTGWATTQAFDALSSGLGQFNVSLADISTIVITHAHPDHIGLVGRIMHVNPSIRLALHRWEFDFTQELFSNYVDLREKLIAIFRKHGVPDAELSAVRMIPGHSNEFSRDVVPAKFLYGGEIISDGVFDLEVIWTPGHSSGHICLYEPRNKLLFSGDHVLPEITPNIGYHSHSGDNPLGDYLCALGKLAHLTVERVLPAHEHDFANLNLRITELVDHHREREAEVGRVIGSKTLNAWEIGSRLTWNLAATGWDQYPPFQKRFAVMETIAHLEHMHWQGQVDRILNDGHVLYRVRR